MNAYKLSGFGCPGDCQLSFGCPDCQLGTLGDLFTQTPNSDWSCADWMYWHKDLAAAYQDGRLARFTRQKALDEANRVFAYHWDHALSWLSPKKFFSSCSYNSDFVNYFKSVGYTDHISFVGAVTSSAAESSVTATDAAGEVINTASNTAKTLKWLLPVALVGVVSIGGYYAYKHYVKGNRRVKVGNKSI